MWLMPSYGRPDAPAKMRAAPGGMPPDVCVLVNEDDPSLEQYVERKLNGDWPSTWRLMTVPAGSRFASAVRYAFETLDPCAFYGIIDDDYHPVTPGWWEKMIDAAGPNGIAIANNKQN